MPIKARDLERMYRTKLKAEVREGKHTYYEVWDEEQKLAVTMLSHDIAEYGEDLLRRVAQQLKVSRKQLQQLLDCPMSREEYVAHIVRQAS